MLSRCKTITLPLPFRLGNVNCYLLKANQGHVLIDTGCSNKRKELNEALEREGCKPGSLRLIIITHGDFDHTGNAAYLRKRYGSMIAMHYKDSGMIERGDMLCNRKMGNIFLRVLIRIPTSIFFGFGKSERFTPDLYIDDGYELPEYGLDASIIHTPGHSRGSISIITAGGDLFCGDLLVNGDKLDQPRLNTIIDDKEAMDRSVRKLKALRINTVYPGHGKPFSWGRLNHL